MNKMEKKSIRKPQKIAAFHVAFSDECDLDAVAEAIRQEGAQVLTIDENVDRESYLQGRVDRNAAVFRVRMEREKPTFAIMSALARIPSVCAASDLQIH